MHQNPSVPYSSTTTNNNNNININLQYPEHEHLNCPRCDSNNTKFCYYNNYNLSQPRHYCKNCRRYWTKGGTLRKIPIGGATRSKPNNKRSSTNSSNKRPPPSDFNSSKSTPQLTDGSEKNKELTKTVETGGDVWPNLSIFASGSNFR